MQTERSSRDFASKLHPLDKHCHLAITHSLGNGFMVPFALVSISDGGPMRPPDEFRNAFWQDTVEAVEGVVLRKFPDCAEKIGFFDIHPNLSTGGPRFLQRFRGHNT